MPGLLDFVSSPAGIGLLSAVAGGLAGARKGTPFNNIGRGLVTGLTGYQAAGELKRKEAEDAFQQKYRTMQMDEIQRKLDEQKALREAGKAAAGKAYPMQTTYAPQSTAPIMPNLSGGNDTIGDYSMMGDVLHGSTQPTAPLDFEMSPQQQQGAFDPAAYRAALQQELLSRGLYEDAAKYGNPDPIKVGAGDTLLDPVTKQPIYTAPTDPGKSPDKVRQYEYAKQQGYDGSFVDFLKIVPELQVAAGLPFKQAGLAIDRARLDIDQAEADYKLPRGKPRPQAAPAFSVRAPDGNVYSFPSQAAADQFKRSIGGR